MSAAVVPFRLVLMSPPAPVANELATLRRLFELGLDTYHLRKPQAPAAALRAYLAGVPAAFHGRIVLHAHHALAAEFGIKGLHLPAAVRASWQPPAGGLGGLSLSTSLHTLAELRQHRRRYDYVFLSPLFDSISKAGYGRAFELAQVQGALAQLQQHPHYRPAVIALGGVTAAHLGTVRQLGFAGAAVLGAVWQSPDAVVAFRQLQAEATR